MGSCSFNIALPHVRTLGLTAFDPLWAEREHYSHGWEMMHIVRGRMTLHMGGRKYPGEPGDTLLVPPDTPHRDAFDLEEGLEVVFCSFAWDAPEDVAGALCMAGVLDASASRRREMRAIFDSMRRDVTTGRQPDAALAGARIATVLFLAAEGVREKPVVSDEPSAGLMNRARAYLETHFAEILTLESIAEALGVSPFHLSHVFSRESRTTLFAYLTDLRMARARELLEKGGRSVAEVAEAVGYASPNYFSKVFRRHAGCAPSAWRGTAVSPVSR